MPAVRTAGRSSAKAPENGNASTYSLPWIERLPGAPYFATSEGEIWTPIGQNDAITWPDINPLFRRQDPAHVENHLLWLKAHGVTCLRLMLEYCHRENRYIERPVGRFQPNMVQLWDDLFELCEKVGMRILLTPFDTYFTWVRWSKHPYNRLSGGPCGGRDQLLICRETREAIKERLAFATRRWGESGVLFAWDLWNELHPAQGSYRFDEMHGFIDEVGGFLRDLETGLYGRAHLQTVSVFGPELYNSPQLNELIFRHPQLDFANSHFYELGTIDDPKNTVAPAVSVGRLAREALAEISDARPFFESEHGPIHAFKDKHKKIPEPFDDEYFRHIQWAHVASGAAGGGMRWPNRHPHVLTGGMRKAQKALSDFLPLIAWNSFQRQNLNAEVTASHPRIHIFASGDAEQALVWLLRGDTIGRNGMLRKDGDPVDVVVTVPGLRAGLYEATFWDTARGEVISSVEARGTGGELQVPTTPLVTDVAIAIRRVAG
jgi:hypothetical protein